MYLFVNFLYKKRSVNSQTIGLLLLLETCYLPKVQIMITNLNSMRTVGYCCIQANRNNVKLSVSE